MKRALLGTAALVGGATLTVGVVAWVLPRWATQQVERAIAEAESTYGVDVTIGSLQAHWARFPRASVLATDVVATNRAPFAGEELLRLDEVEVAVDLRHLFGERLMVQHLEIDGAQLQLLRTEDGTNWSQGDRSGSPSSWEFELDHVGVADLGVDYDDATSGMRTVVEGVRFDGMGVLNGTALRFDAEAHADALTVATSTATWVEALPIDVQLPFVYDKRSSGLVFTGVRGTVGPLPLTLDGSLVPADDGWEVGLNLAAPDATVGQVLAVLPGVRQEAVDLQTSGDLALSAQVVGRYTEAGWPGGEVRLDLSGGEVARSADGLRIDQLDAQVLLTREDGPLLDTQIDEASVSLRWGGEPFVLGAVAAPPLNRPAQVEAWGKGKLDLAKLGQLVPLKTPLSGKVDLDARVEAQGTTVRSGSGTVAGTGLRWGEGDDAMWIDVADLALDGGDLTVNALAVRTGDTDLSAEGVLRGVVPWWTADGVLGGELSLVADRLDLRSSGEGSSGTLTVPQDLDLAVTARAAELVTDELTVYDAVGSVRLQEGVATVDRASGSALGGSLVLSGRYATNEGAPFGLTGEVQLKRLRLDALMAQVGLLQRVVPIAERAGGRVSGDLSVDTTVASDGSVVVEALSGDGSVTLSEGSSLTPPILKEAARRLGLPALANLDLDGARVDFRIREGRLKLQPMSVELGPFASTLRGDVGVVDRTLGLAFDLALPVGRLAQAQGLNLPVGAREVDLTLNVTGPYDAPKLGIAAGDATQQALDAVRDEAVDLAQQELSKLIAEAAKQGDALIAQAEAAAKKLKAEAAKQAATVRSEARTQADQLVGRAKGPIAKAAAQVAADEAVKVANRAARSLEREAAREADRLVEEARDAKDQLLAEARRATR